MLVWPTTLLCVFWLIPNSLESQVLYLNNEFGKGLSGSISEGGPSSHHLMEAICRGPSNPGANNLLQRINLLVVSSWEHCISMKNSHRPEFSQWNFNPKLDMEVKEKFRVMSFKMTFIDHLEKANTLIGTSAMPKI